MEIFSLHRNIPRLVKTVSVGAPVLCLEGVKEPCVSSQEREAAKPGNIICVGLQDGRSHIPSSLVFDEDLTAGFVLYCLTKSGFLKCLNRLCLSSQHPGVQQH